MHKIIVKTVDFFYFNIAFWLVIVNTKKSYHQILALYEAKSSAQNMFFQKNLKIRFSLYICLKSCFYLILKVFSKTKLINTCLKAEVKVEKTAKQMYQKPLNSVKDGSNCKSAKDKFMKWRLRKSRNFEAV